MKIINVDQGTQEWLDLRVGKITGTRLKSVMGSKKVREELIYELIAEELTGVQEQLYKNAAMQWGSDHEDMAVLVYEHIHKVKTEKVGFCISDEFDFLGLSPDRLIKKGKNYVKAVEVKAPTTKTAVKYIVDGKVPAEYKWQVVNYFLVNEKLKELDFVIYDPRITIPTLQLTVISVARKTVSEDVAKAKEVLATFKKEWEAVRNKIIT